jgi:uncharacterized protein YecA (UPF0149 family)
MTHIKTEVVTAVFRVTTVQNFQRMMSSANAQHVQTVHTDINILSGTQTVAQSEPPAPAARRELSSDVPPSAAANFDAMLQALDQPARAPVQRQASGAAVGRNDPCPCGSGKKYKKCCGQGL